MKKLASLILVFILILPHVVFADVPPVKVTLNGLEIKFDVPPQIINGRTMVPSAQCLKS